MPISAAANQNTLMIVSNASTTFINDISSAVPSGLHWAQLYIVKQRKYTKWYVEQAERAGVKALVLTVDVPLLAPRPVSRLTRYESENFR